jgi:type IV secretion system protein VirD4
VLTRFFLIVSVLLVAYGLVLVAVLFPWMWLVIGIAVVYLCKKRHSWHAFGTARWADINDLWAQDMVDGGNGLIVGHIGDSTGGFAAIRGLFNPAIPSHIACQQLFQNRRKPPRKLVRLNRPPHILVCAPTGVGKGVSCVLPHLLTCPDSMVVLDYKGENARISANARRKMGHEVVILDPALHNKCLF